MSSDEEIEGALDRAKILIVDDDAANVLLLERALRKTGYRRVWSTTESRQAMPLVRDVQPDLVLLDVHMPKPDGFEVLGLIREDLSRDDYLPVLMLTADVQSEVKIRALGYGAQDFLTRPLDLKEVLLRVRTQLEVRFLVKELGERAEGPKGGLLPGHKTALGDSDALGQVRVYFRCRSCGDEHPAPIQFSDRAALLRTHLSTNVWRCPVRKVSARYGKGDLIWRTQAAAEASEGQDPD